MRGETQTLNGKPKLLYSIESAKKSKYINRIFVSTDSKKIQKIVRNKKIISRETEKGTKKMILSINQT
mgnify:CR=1 FL=1